MDILGEFLVGTDGFDHSRKWGEGSLQLDWEGETIVAKSIILNNLIAEYWITMCCRWSLHSYPAGTYCTKQVIINMGTTFAISKKIYITVFPQFTRTEFGEMK